MRPQTEPRIPDVARDAAFAPARTDAGHDASPWWVNPVGLFLFFLIPAYCFIFAMPDLLGDRFVNIRYRVYLNLESFALGLLFLLTLTYGAALGALRLPGGRRAAERRDARRESFVIAPAFLDFLALTAIVAYAIWFHRLVLYPDRLLQLLTNWTFSRAQNPNIPGITSAVQFGVAYSIAFLVTRWNPHAARLPWRYTAYFVVIAALSLFRVFAWAERLTFVELVLPVVLLAIAFGKLPRVRAAKTVTALAPYVGLAVLFAYFSLTEYFRSWTFYSTTGNQEFWRFSISRLASYYFTSLNNGAGLLQNTSWPTFEFSTIFAWAYRLPLAGPIIQFVFEAGRVHHIDYLVRYGDPEFNNMSGIFSAYHDLGIPGALLYALGWGVLMGFLFRRYQDGASIGLLLYPALYISLIELFRYSYLGATRAFPIILILVITQIFFVRKLPGPGREAPAARS